jgi:hypothetical protein
LQTLDAAVNLAAWGRLFVHENNRKAMFRRRNSRRHTSRAATNDHEIARVRHGVSDRRPSCGSMRMPSRTVSRQA